MSVLSCIRKGCERIMCDTYVDGIGYVCTECQEEFKDYLNTKNSSNLNQWGIKEELEKFIHTYKGVYKKNISVSEFFNNYLIK